MADKLFRVIEHFNGYEVEHIPSGQRHWMSDGVDVIPLNDEGDYMAPGSEEFRQAWEDQLNSDPEALEAYFPDIANPPEPPELSESDKYRLALLLIGAQHPAWNSNPNDKLVMIFNRVTADAREAVGAVGEDDDQKADWCSDEADRMRGIEPEARDDEDEE